MLTMNIDVIAALLDKAARIEASNIAIEEEDGADASDGSDPDEEFAGEDGAHSELVAAVAGLSPGEVNEILTLHWLGGEGSGTTMTWQDAMDAAQNVPDEERLETLVEALILAEAIEASLAALGYSLDEDEDEDEDEAGADEEG